MARKSSKPRVRSGVVSLRGDAAHDFINGMKAATGDKHCTPEVHLAGCGHAPAHPPMSRDAIRREASDIADHFVDMFAADSKLWEVKEQLTALLMGRMLMAAGYLPK